MKHIYEHFRVCEWTCVINKDNFTKHKILVVVMHTPYYWIWLSLRWQRCFAAHLCNSQEYYCLTANGECYYSSNKNSHNWITFTSIHKKRGNGSSDVAEHKKKSRMHFRRDHLYLKEVILSRIWRNIMYVLCEMWVHFALCWNIDFLKNATSTFEVQ